MQAGLRQALRDRLASPPAFEADRFAGRGIVTCAGGTRYFTCVFVLIWVLRRVHRCTLPIQVWHLGRAEMSEGMRLILEAEDVEVVDAETVVSRHPARVCGGWPLKPYAIAQSRFREVLFFDADTVLLANPAAVFDWDAYREAGLLVWPDVLDLKATNPVWEKLGLPARDCVSVDSGVLAVDKTRAWSVLDLAVLLNAHWEDVYDVIYGDKDTFLLASMLAGHACAMIEQRPLQKDGDLIQRDPRGEPFLHHRTISKWHLAGPNKPVFDAALDAACAQALTELRRRWSGAVFHAPVRSARAQQCEAELAACRWFHYATSVTPGRRLELLPGGRVEEGRADCEQHWAVIERDAQLVLQFYSDVCLAVELRQCQDGTWRGASVGAQPFEARLLAADQRRTWPGAEGAASCTSHLSALLAPNLFGAGPDATVENELRAALSLLNRIFPDVPERLAEHLGAMAIGEGWRATLTGLARELACARDARLALTRERATARHLFDAPYYDRVT